MCVCVFIASRQRSSNLNGKLFFCLTNDFQGTRSFSYTRRKSIHVYLFMKPAMVAVRQETLVFYLEEGESILLKKGTANKF